MDPIQEYNQLKVEAQKAIADLVDHGSWSSALIAGLRLVERRAFAQTREAGLSVDERAVDACDEARRMLLGEDSRTSCEAAANRAYRGCETTNPEVQIYLCHAAHCLAALALLRGSEPSTNIPVLSKSLLEDISKNLEQLATELSYGTPQIEQNEELRYLRQFFVQQLRELSDYGLDVRSLKHRRRLSPLAQVDQQIDFD